MTQPARVGLIGAGPWAHDFTAPMVARSSALDLVGVWARQPSRAADVATAHDADVVADLDELVAQVDALAFAVAPDAQAEIIGRVAPSGLPMLLEKPVARTLDAAERTVEILERFDVPTMMVLTNRYIDPVIDLLDVVDEVEPRAARAEFIAAGAVDGARYATPWRRRDGAVLDLGPHVLDVLDAACGTIERVDAFGDPVGVVEIICHHRSGVTSSAAVSITTPGEPSGLELTVWGARGRRSTSVSWNDEEMGSALFDQAMTRVADGFAEMIATRTSHRLDARHGVRLQRLVHDATSSLATR